MQAPELEKWAKILEEKATALYPATDPSHDLLHIRRVVKTALHLAEEEGAAPAVVLPAAYLHDFVNVPKDDPRRKEASRLSAKAAIEYLAAIGYPPQYFDAIAHAVAAHSFSANITPETLEAKVVQDADRLDGLGAIGIARCFSTSTLMRRPYYCPEDAWGELRELDDCAFAIDHFPVKLFKVAETMQTASARLEARRRVEFMKLYLQQLQSEI
jgi:uncharacterized protein